MKVLRYISLLVIILSIGINLKAQTVDTVCAFSQTKVYKVIPTQGSTYFWSVDCGTIVSDNVHADSIVVLWCNNPGIYQVKVIEKNKTGCWGDTVSTLVVVNPKMHLSIFGPAQQCVGAPVWLYASGASSYQWNTGQTTGNISAKLQDTNTTFQVIGRNACEIDTASFTIKVHPAPVASFTYAPQNPIVNEPVILHYTGKDASDWTWYITDQPSIGGASASPQITFVEKGTETIKLIAVNQYGCVDTAIENINIGYEAMIYVPDVFTPDGNGINDSFRAVGFNLKNIHMMIFNRWGEKLFESYHVYDAWDGTFKGQVVMEGVYIYLIDAEATDGRHYYLNGNVTVMH